MSPRLLTFFPFFSYILSFWLVLGFSTYWKVHQEDLPSKAPSKRICLLKFRQEDLLRQEDLPSKQFQITIHVIWSGRRPRPDCFHGNCDRFCYRFGRWILDDFWDNMCLQWHSELQCRKWRVERINSGCKCLQYMSRFQNSTPSLKWSTKTD